MTRSWDAFEEFRGGLESWQEFTLHRGLGDPDALSGAIRHFRAATAIDPAFALAHYRLGVALHNDGQPLAAAEALRASLKANPGFVPAMVALASVLYSSEHDLGVPLIGLPRIPHDETGKTRAPGGAASLAVGHQRRKRGIVTRSRRGLGGAVSPRARRAEAPAPSGSSRDGRSTTIRTRCPIGSRTSTASRPSGSTRRSWRRPARTCA